MFSVGFLKVAMVGHNNQGLEFRKSEEPSSMSGPGGIADANLPDYGPAVPKGKKSKDKLSDIEVAQLMMAKSANIRGNTFGSMGNAAEQRMPTAEGVSGQLDFYRRSGVKYPNEESPYDGPKDPAAHSRKTRRRK